MQSLLNIKNLNVSTEEKAILKNLNLQVGKGEIHAIMGPNGSGKSTLSYAIMGHPNYVIDSGKITFNNKNILDLPADKRAKEGLFLSFQTPIEITGLNFLTFLKTSYVNYTSNNIPLYKFKKFAKEELEKLNISEDFLKRDLNSGFSGGEKKRAEILQLNLLKPKLAILDETDSGLDIDSLKLVANSVNNLKKENKEFSALVITHYKRILDFITPDYVHILYDGKIIKSGDKKLANYIEKNGFKKIISDYKNKK